MRSRSNLIFGLALFSIVLVSTHNSFAAPVTPRNLYSRSTLQVLDVKTGKPVTKGVSMTKRGSLVIDYTKIPRKSVTLGLTKKGDSSSGVVFYIKGEVFSVADSTPWLMTHTDGRSGQPLPLNLPNGTYPVSFKSFVTGVAAGPRALRTLKTQTVIVQGQATARAASSYNLLLSSSPDRSNPVPLSGKSVSGNIYVFTSPETGVKQVQFFLDNTSGTGTPRQTENVAPYDFASTGTSGANAFNTSTITTGSHTITAKIILSTGATSLISAPFTVASLNTPTPIPVSGESIFSPTLVPASLNNTDGVGSNGDYELGVEFKSAVAGQIKAVRYYKASSETGTHTGRIWSSTGTLLASVAFANETASGWQQQLLSTPLTINANTTYVVSVNTNSYYVDTVNGIATTVTNGDLSAVADGSNGVYNEAPGSFPTASWNNSNYFRDIVFTPGTATPVPTATAVATSTSTPTATRTSTPTTVPPTSTPTVAPTATLVPTPVPTQVPTATSTAIPTATATKAATSTPTKIPTQVATSTPTSQNTPTWSGPVVITQGGTYTGKWRSTNPDIPAVKVTTNAPVIIQDCQIESAGYGILASSGGAQLTVRNCYGKGVNPNIANSQKGNFIAIANFSQAIIEYNTMDSFGNGIQAYNYNTSTDNYRDNGVAGQNVIIRYNRLKNVDGRLSDGNGGYLTNLSGSYANAIRLDGLVNVKAEIAWNEVINKPFESRVEDLISTFHSSGTSAYPIAIHDNYLQGGYAPDPSAYVDYSGSMINVADAAEPGYVVVYNNQAVSFENSGIQITGGHNNEVHHNRVISAQKLSNGTIQGGNWRQGLVFWDVYNGAANGYWHDNNMHDNSVNVVNRDGNLAGNYLPSVGGSNTVTGTTDPLGHPATQADEVAEYQFWIQKKTGVNVGCSSWAGCQ